MSSARASARSAAASSNSGRASTRRRTGSSNSLPITAAVCSTCFSRAGSRSMRAASTTWTDAGRASVSTGARRRYAPLEPKRLPASASVWTTSSAKNGLPAVRSPTRSTSPATDGSEPELAQQLAARLRTEGQEWQLLVVRLLHPTGVVLRAKVDQEERARAGYRVDQRLHKGRAAVVDPVEILEQQQRRLAAAARLADLLGEREEASQPRLGIHARGRIGGGGDAEKVEDQRQGIGQRRIEQQQGAGDLAPCRFVAVLLGEPEEVAHQLEDRQEGDHLAVRDAVRGVDAHALGASLFGQLVTQAALPNAGLAHDPDYASLALERACHGGFDHCHLVGAADEARKAARL